MRQLNLVTPRVALGVTADSYSPQEAKPFRQKKGPEMERGLRRPSVIASAAHVFLGMRGLGVRRRNAMPQPWWFGQ
jgi:hypothetical protein